MHMEILQSRQLADFPFSPGVLVTDLCRFRRLMERVVPLELLGSNVLLAFLKGTEEWAKIRKSPQKLSRKFHLSLSGCVEVTL